ncbi:MAG: winged helix-turn-helix domain-containing protein [Methanolobus sp.]|uniref:helix-turn-helix transcriptional regulator n=1 Tax=Methanolobus sp. TaxID=1874737 RepID=UPI0027316A33|nr:winged helix-turn-helix domain-containing protein [Methanolobus sp.]MDP2216186.1 winged helix-turn-helix domain-containing protein [Methanolobus sp.]
MRCSLLDTIFLSEKRKDLLLFLKEGGKTKEEIRENFDFPWKSMIPQIKKLLEWNLLTYENDIYSLTPTGEAIVENMQNLLMSLNVHEEKLEYWSDHDLSPIPRELLYRIGELEQSEVLEPNIPSIFEQQDEILKRISGSSRISAFISVYHPSYFLPFSSYLEKGIKVSVIMTEQVYDILKDDMIRDSGDLPSENPLSLSMRKDYEKEIEALFKNGSSHIFIYREDIRPVSIIVTDRLLSLSLMDRNGRYTNRIIVSSRPRALQWGEELFQYYMDRSEGLDKQSLAKKYLAV